MPDEPYDMAQINVNFFLYGNFGEQRHFQILAHGSEHPPDRAGDHDEKNPSEDAGGERPGDVPGFLDKEGQPLPERRVLIFWPGICM
jgi:hypothetical protein